MIYAYDEIYLEDAMRCLGEAFDYAVYRLNELPENFFALFSNSTYGMRFEHGDSSVISGMTGAELASRVFAQAGRMYVCDSADYVDYTYSAEYWMGWILAYYQWYSARSFVQIGKVLPIAELRKMYTTFHEEGEDKFVSVVDKKMATYFGANYLQKRRRNMGYSQAELAKKSAMSLRSLQQYESGARSLSKASYETLRKLAIVLQCSVEDFV